MGIGEGPWVECGLGEGPRMVQISERGMGSSVDSGQGPRLSSWTRNRPAGMPSLLFT